MLHVFGMKILALALDNAVACSRPRMRCATAAVRAFLGTCARCKAGNKSEGHVRQAPCSELFVGWTRWRLLRARRTLELGAAVSIEQGFCWAHAPGARQPRTLGDICTELPACSWSPGLTYFLFRERGAQNLATR